jgi:hypothetical protein
VDDARPEDAADTRESRDVVEKRVDQRPARVARGGMDDDAGGLVEDEEVAILVEDCEGKVLGLGECALGGRNGHLEALPALEALRGAARAAIHEDAPGLEQTLDPRPTERGEARRDGPVESLPSERRSGGEPMNLIARCLVPLWACAHA